MTPFPPTPEWMADALCAQTDPDAYFPEKGGSTREAKRVCASCDVVRECLAYAIANDERYGIWGGTSERERRALRRPAGPARCGTRAAWQAHRKRGEEPCEPCRAANSAYHAARAAKRQGAAS